MHGRLSVREQAVGPAAPLPLFPATAAATDGDDGSLLPCLHFSPPPPPPQTISFTLKSHLEDPAAASALSSLLPGIMEVLAGLIEEELPTAVAPLAAQVGPLIDGKAMDRALNALYRDCTTSARAAKAAGRAATAAAATAAAAPSAAASGTRPAPRDDRDDEDSLR